jgi:hypothetical protein
MAILLGDICRQVWILTILNVPSELKMNFILQFSLFFLKETLVTLVLVTEIFTIHPDAHVHNFPFTKYQIKQHLPATMAKRSTKIVQKSSSG